VVTRNGRLTGYATSIGFFGHAIGETTSDLEALIGASSSFAGPGFIVPLRNTELMVSRPRPAHYAADDVDDDRALSRASRCIPSFHSVLSDDEKRFRFMSGADSENPCLVKGA
jgi:hypothetical protein